MENHHFQSLNPLQITIFNSYVRNYQRVGTLELPMNSPQHI